MDKKREYRRKRRVKNQIIAYCVLVIILLLLVLAAVFGFKQVKASMEQKALEESAAAEAERIAQEEAAAAAAEAEVAAMLEEASQAETETAAEYTEEDALEELVSDCVENMPLEDKVAGLFMVTPEQITGVNTAVKAGDGTKEALEKYPVGGLIYFEKNIQSEEQITEMLSNTAEYSTYPVFLAVDEEGGSVSRVAKALKLDNVGDMADIGESGDAQAAYDAGQTIGTYLTEYGFNVNFALVADVLTNPDNKVIADRAFGSDATVVSEMVAKAVEGLESTGVSACVKHFPGHGNTAADSHTGAAETDRTKAEMQETEFLPFQSAIDAGVDMIMVGHISATELTGGDKIPASLSEEIITGILRKELGYDGIIITDAMDMAAVTDYYQADVAAITALKAGADMILMPEDFETAYEGVLNAVQDGTISEERINDSLKRIYRIKYKDFLEE